MATSLTVSAYGGAEVVPNTSDSYEITFCYWRSLVTKPVRTKTIYASGDYLITIICRTGETINGESSLIMDAGAGECVQIEATITDGEFIVK